MSYRCPQPTANSGRERRKAQVDRRFQATRASCNMQSCTGKAAYSISAYSPQFGRNGGSCLTICSTLRLWLTPSPSDPMRMHPGRLLS